MSRRGGQSALQRQPPVAVDDPADVDECNPFPAAPFLGAPVILVTREPIDGQREHAALVTKVLGDGAVNLVVFPSGAPPYPALNVLHAAAKAPAAWRWPDGR